MGGWGERGEAVKGEGVWDWEGREPGVEGGIQWKLLGLNA